MNRRKCQFKRNCGKNGNAHNLLGQLELDESHFDAARKHLTTALSLFQQLQMPHKIDLVKEQLTIISITEKASASWAAHATILAGGGILVAKVIPGKEAEKAGIQPGDILIRYATTRLEKPDALRPLVEAADPKKTFPIELLRGKEKITVKVHGGLLGIMPTPVPPKPANPTAQKN